MAKYNRYTFSNCRRLLPDTPIHVRSFPCGFSPFTKVPTYLEQSYGRPVPFLTTLSKYPHNCCRRLVASLRKYIVFGATLLERQHRTTPSSPTLKSSHTVNISRDIFLLDNDGDYGLEDEEPTLASLGLAGWLPTGFIQWGLEKLHINCSLPWWAAIMVAALIIKLILFYFELQSMRKPKEFDLIYTMTNSRMMARYYSNKQTSWGEMLLTISQLAITPLMFFSLSGMVNLPVWSMKTGGCLWFSDLTEADYIFAFPLMVSLLGWVVSEAKMDDRMAEMESPYQRKMRFWYSLLLLPFISFVSSAFLLYWFTYRMLEVGQALMLKDDRVREFLALPKE